LINQAYKNLPPKSAEYYCASTLSLSSKKQTTTDIENSLKEFKKRFPNSRYIAQLEQVINKKQRTSDGNQAIDFIIKPSKGKSIRLSSLKNNVVCLDFWSRALPTLYI
jgi:hypothetical protein